MAQPISQFGPAVVTFTVRPSRDTSGIPNSEIPKAFQARDVMVWSTDAAVQATLAARGWDGALPKASGDFFDDAEFEYGAKNGSGIKRSFVDQVAIRADGSAQVTTTITIDNTEAASDVNNNVLTYYTIYGPTGATLDPTLSDPPVSTEPSLAGHPAAGWFRTVAALSTGTLKVVWDVPAAAQQFSDGTWHYSLDFQHIVDNTGDTLRLTVTLPGGAKWVGQAPPGEVRLSGDLRGTWIFRLAR